MGYDIYESCERLISKWWLLLLVGVVAIVAGFVVLINPMASYRAIALWLGVAVLLSGVFGLALSISSSNYFVRSIWLVLASLADIVIGILLMTNILLSELVLPVVFGIWLLYRGVATLLQGMDLKSYYVRGAGWVIFGAVLIIAISFAILWLPATVGVGSLILFIAVAFIVYGVSQVSMAYKLQEIHRKAKSLQ